MNLAQALIEPEQSQNEIKLQILRLMDGYQLSEVTDTIGYKCKSKSFDDMEAMASLKSVLLALLECDFDTDTQTRSGLMLSLMPLLKRIIYYVEE